MICLLLLPPLLSLSSCFFLLFLPSSPSITQAGDHLKSFATLLLGLELCWSLQLPSLVPHQGTALVLCLPTASRTWLRCGAECIALDSRDTLIGSVLRKALQSPDQSLEMSSSLLHSLSFPYWVCSSYTATCLTLGVGCRFCFQPCQQMPGPQMRYRPILKGYRALESSNAGLTSSETISRRSRKDFSVLYLYSHPVPSTGIHAEPGKY